MLGLLAALRLHPHLVGPDGLRIRNGTTVDVAVPWAAVASVTAGYRSLPSSRTIQVEQGASTWQPPAPARGTDPARSPS